MKKIMIPLVAVLVLLALWLVFRAAPKKETPLYPELHLNVNRGIKKTVYPGEPMTAEVTVHQETGTFKLGSKKPWPEHIILRITDAKGKETKWPWKLTAMPEPGLVLEPEALATARWTISPEARQKLRAGKYSMEAHFAVSRKLSLKSNRVELEITGKKAETPPEAEKQVLWAKADAAVRSGDKQETLEYADQILAKSPDSVRALTMKADVLVSRGEDEKALELYQKALDIAAGFREPKPDLIRKYDAVWSRVSQKRAAQRTIQPNPTEGAKA